MSKEYKTVVYSEDMTDERMDMVINFAKVLIFVRLNSKVLRGVTMQ
jgi:hypothetical protein